MKRPCNIGPATVLCPVYFFTTIVSDDNSIYLEQCREFDREEAKSVTSASQPHSLDHIQGNTVG